jgi:IS30 family transposase
MPPSTLVESSNPSFTRYLSFAEREELAILRAQRAGVRAIARQMERSASRSHENCDVTPRRAAAAWAIGRPRRSGMPSEPPGARSLRSWRLTWRCGGMCRIDWLIWSSRQSALRSSGQRFLGKVAATDLERIGVGLRRGALSRLPIDCASIFRTTMRISHEAVYQSLYVQGRGALRRELTACLRTGRALRVPRAQSRGRGKWFIVPEIMISERPAEAADRAVPGHWEGDLILGLDSSAIRTLVERTTRFKMLLHLPRMAEHGVGARIKNGPALAGHGAEAVRDNITSTITRLPEHLRRSLTWAQGAEVLQHARLKIDKGVEIYFCDRYSPWQRGTNENTNGAAPVFSEGH